MVVMDAGTLLLLFRPDVDPPVDPATGKPVEAIRERLGFLVKTLEKAKTKIIIPTPALSEMLVRAGHAGPPLIEEIGKHSVFKVTVFDTLAAIEVAAMTRKALQAGDKRGGLQSTWAKVKYDRQIVAIARVAQATAIYSDDRDIGAIAREVGINVISVVHLPLPPSNAQGKLALEAQSLPSQDDAEISDSQMDALIAEANLSASDLLPE